MKHIMIDLETMGIGPEAAIVAIGAVQFDPAVMYDPRQASKFYTNVDLATSLAAGLKVTAGAIYWWLDREPEVQKMLRAERSTLPRALVQLSEFLSCIEEVPGDQKLTKVWCRGLNFDLVILDSAYRLCDLVSPWRYDFGRDTRTYFEAMNNYQRRPPPKHAHNALVDAEWEAQEVCRAYQSVYGANKNPTPENNETGS